MTIGTRIKLSRESKNMTQEELGIACGTTKQSIFKYETGVVTNIPLDRLERIAEALDVSPAYLMGWEDEIQSDPTSIRQQIDDRDIKAAFFEGSGATDEEMDALWDDARDYIAYKLAQKRRKSDG